MSPLSSPHMISKSISFGYKPTPIHHRAPPSDVTFEIMVEENSPTKPASTSVHKVANHEWVCSCCSFTNADNNNTRCCMCGIIRDDTRLPSVCETESTLDESMSSFSSSNDRTPALLYPNKLKPHAGDFRRKMFQVQAMSKLIPSGMPKFKRAGADLTSSHLDVFQSTNSMRTDDMTNVMNSSEHDNDIMYMSSSSDISLVGPDNRTLRRVDKKFTSNSSRKGRGFRRSDSQENGSSRRQEIDQRDVDGATKPRLASTTRNMDMHPPRMLALSDKALKMSFASWNMEDTKAWICTMCTFENDNALHLKCDVCGTNRDFNGTPRDSEVSSMSNSLNEMSFHTSTLGDSTQFVDKHGLGKELMKERIDELILQQRQLMEDFKKDSPTSDDQTLSSTEIQMQREQALRRLSTKHSQLVDAYKNKREDQAALFRQESKRQLTEKQQSPNVSSWEERRVPSQVYRTQQPIASTEQEAMLDEWGMDLEQHQELLSALKKEQEFLWNRITMEHRGT